MKHPSLETLKLFKMYMERKKVDHKFDLSKSPEENLAEYINIGMAIDRVSNAIEYVEMIQS